MRFVPINIKRVTELIFLIMEYAMYCMQKIRNIQRSQGKTDQLVGIGHNLVLEGIMEDCQNTTGFQVWKSE